MNPPGSGDIRRILVALDASPLAQAAAEAAARLAGRLGAELDALFVEDINVIRLVAHPHVHTFSLAAARRQALDDVLIEKAMELQAVAARRVFEAAQAASGSRAAFAVRRGRVDVELLAAAHGADLVCLGWSGRAEPGARPRLGSVARRVAAAAPGPVLMLQKPASGPTMVLWDGSQGARKAMDLAVALAGPDGGTLDLLVPDPDVIEGTRLAVDAMEMLAERGLVARIRAVGRLSKVLAAAAPDGTLLAAESAFSLDEAPCSVLWVR